MKKIMIAAFAAMLGIAANAASVTWGLTSVTGPDTKEAPSGWVAYVLDSSDYSTFAALDGDKVAAFAAANAIVSGTTASGRTGTAVSISGGSFAANENVSTFMVIFDNANAAKADYYAYTTVGNTTISEGGSNGSIGHGTFAAATASTGGWTATAVPEPTSGLLMLVGLAGLALRRRRA